MKIQETDKSRIKLLMDLAAQQIDSIDSLTVDVNGNFDISPYIPQLIYMGWPAAVDPLLIADPNSEPDKFSRAHAILNMVVTDPLSSGSSRFLDFGCGEGHIVSTAADRSLVSVGYDVKEDNWKRHPARPNMVLTTNWADVEKNAPYTTVLIYDVLDHVKDEAEAVKCLSMIKSVIADNGRIFLRCHPWCSRHGTHLYQKLNKAYIHICLDESKIKEMGFEGIHTIKLIHPLDAYKKWFSEVGLRIVSNNVIREVVEPFFQDPTIANLIKAHWKTSHDEDLASGRRFPIYQTEQQFVDFLLTK